MSFNFKLKKTSYSKGTLIIIEKKVSFLRLLRREGYPITPVLLTYSMINLNKPVPKFYINALSQSFQTGS